jgi:hypothetical protein
VKTWIGLVCAEIEPRNTIATMKAVTAAGLSIGRTSHELARIMIDHIS